MRADIVAAWTTPAGDLLDRRRRSLKLRHQGCRGASANECTYQGYAEDDRSDPQNVSPLLLNPAKDMRQSGLRKGRRSRKISAA
jgi:hypothetical protein